MKHKVLIFVQDGVGGAERVSVLIGKSLMSDINEVCFCVVENTVKTSIVDFIPAGMRIKRIPNKNPLQLMWSMVTTIIKEKPYAVFSSVLNLNNKILPCRWLFPKVKVIIRCDNYLYTYNERQQRMVSNLYPKADCIIAQTEEMREELLPLRGIDASKVVALHNPIDVQTIEKKLIDSSNPYKQENITKYVASGRFSYQKGYDMLVDAFAIVCQSNPASELYILGDTSIEDGKPYEIMMEKAKENGIPDKIHCVGYQNNPYPYIKNADCFVLSSRWEGLPNVLIESLYLGTPAAAFKCIPIIERIIDEGKTGFCAEKEDVESLARCMIKAADLGRVTTTYKSSSIDDFTILFE